MPWPSAPRQARAAGPTEHGLTKHGKAGCCHARFNGRRMADGERFDPGLPTAAHKTLPLGTVVRVTDLENGRTALVRVTDRGPSVRGRMIDLAPRTAEHPDMKQEGVVQVAVTPLQAPEEIAKAR